MSSGPPLPHPVAARSALRDAVLDAMDEHIRARGWAATRMSDVAKAAGMSRQTVYNEFGSRSALGEAYLAREVEGLVGQVADAVRADADDPHRALRSAFELFSKLASDEPVVQLIVADADPGDLIRLLTGVGQAVAGRQMADLIAEVWPQVSVADAQLLAETVVRLAISHALLPLRDPGAVADGVARMLAPFVDDILTDQGEPAGSR